MKRLILSIILIILFSSIAFASIWPMFQHDAQHTGRSQFVGPQNNNTMWRFKSPLNNTDGVGSPVIGSDGTIYVGLGSGLFPNFARLYAVYPNGTKKWESLIMLSVPSVPGIGLDGTVYTGTADFGTTFFALDPNNGSEINRIEGLNRIDGVTIGPDGTIYFVKEGFPHTLFAVYPNLTPKWSVTTAGSLSPPAIGLNDTVYLYGTGYDPINGSVRYNLQRIGEITVRNDGNLYITTNDLSIDPDSLALLMFNGSLVWEKDFAIATNCPVANNVVGPAAIASDGTIIVSTLGFFFVFEGALRAYDPIGNEKWTLCFGNMSINQPVIGDDDTVYVYLNDAVNAPGIGILLAVDASTGTQKWNYTFMPAIPSVRSNLAIDNGTLYISLSNSAAFELVAFGPQILQPNITMKEPWQLRQEHFKVIIDPGHGFWKSSDPFSDNATKRMNYPDRPIMFILKGLVRSQNGGKAFRGPGIPRTDFDYTEGEGTTFFSRALKEKFDAMNISHDFTRDLTVSFDVLLGTSNLSVRKPNANNDWRHASVPYLKSVGKAPPGNFPENQAGNINIRWNFANREQGNDSIKDVVFISLHSNAGASSRRGTVTGWVSSGPTNPINSTTKCEIKGTPLPLDQLSESKKAFAEFVHASMIQELRINTSPTWNDIGVVDARVSGEFCVTPAVLKFTQIPSALTEIAFHTNIEDLKFLNYTNLTSKRVVANGIYKGIIKFFNSSVDSYDSLGNKKDSFVLNENVYAKGTGFPPNKNVTIFVTVHKDVTKNEWNRTVKFSSVRINSVNTTTDVGGNLPLTNVWTANASGNYDIVVAIYNTTHFNYVDALDDLAGVAGFTVV